PGSRPVRQLDGGYTAAGLVQTIVNVFAVGCAAENDQAGSRGRAFRDVRPPDNVAVFVEIERKSHAAFTPGDQNVAAVRKCVDDEGGSAEIVVRNEFCREVVALFAAGSAVIDEDVALEFLVLPENLAGVHIHGDDGIRAFRRGFAYAIAGADINPMA